MTSAIFKTPVNSSRRAALFATSIGGVSALGAALYSIGIPKNSVIEYEESVKTDGYLVVGHGSADEMARSKVILDANNPARVDVHKNIEVQVANMTT